MLDTNGISTHLDGRGGSRSRWDRTRREPAPQLAVVAVKTWYCSPHGRLSGGGRQIRGASFQFPSDCQVKRGAGWCARFRGGVNRAVAGGGGGGRTMDADSVLVVARHHGFRERSCSICRALYRNTFLTNGSADWFGRESAIGALWWWWWSGEAPHIGYAIADSLPYPFQKLRPATAAMAGRESVQKNIYFCHPAAIPCGHTAASRSCA